jgi:hypothetical protein
MIDLAGISADSHQANNVAGNTTKVAIVLAKQLTANWPVKASITAGEITVAPPLAATKNFSIIEVPQNSIRTYDSKKGDPGFNSIVQGIEFNMAGFSKGLIAELEKHQNAGCVFLVEDANGIMTCVGSKQNPIFLNYDGDSGKIGTDKRGYMLKGESDGYFLPRLPVATSVVSGLTFNLPA